jgi:hypothetical protein
MTDRRAAHAIRLLDPVWHQMRTALERLYAEIELDAIAVALNVTVDNADGTVATYLVMLDTGQLQRRVLTDPDGVANAVGAATVEVSVPPYP